MNASDCLFFALFLFVTSNGLRQLCIGLLSQSGQANFQGENMNMSCRLEHSQSQALKESAIVLQQKSRDVELARQNEEKLARYMLAFNIYALASSPGKQVHLLHLQPILSFRCSTFKACCKGLFSSDGSRVENAQTRNRAAKPTGL